MKLQYILKTILVLGTAITANAQQKLIHYWHFNNFTSNASAAVDPTTLVPYRADYSLFDTSVVKVSYTAIPGTSTAYKTYWDVSTGDSINLKNGAVAGNCLRLRNPSDSMQLAFRIPSTLFKNITIRYEVQKSSASNGAVNNWFSYSIDGGTNWLTSGLSATSYTVTNYSGGTPAWPLTATSVTITDSLAFNNPNLVFRIRFDGSGSTGTSGNNRIDNFSVEGDTIVYPTLSHTGTLSPFITSKNIASSAQQILVSGVNLLDSVHIQAPVYFSMSLTANGTYSSSLSLAPIAGSISRNIYIRFLPTDTGTFTGQLNVTSMNASSHTVSVTGTTLPVPIITVAGPSSISFSNTQPGQSVHRNMVVSAINLTDTLLLITHAPFSLSLDSVSVGSLNLKLSGATVAGTTVYVLFKPTAYGVYSDTLQIGSAGANTFTIPLSGSSIAKPVLNITNAAIDTFKDVTVGGNSTAHSLRITGMYLTTSVSLTVSNPFKLSVNQATFTNSVLLNPSTGILDTVVYVYFNPTQSGVFNSTVMITSTDTGTISIPVYGTTFNPFAGMNLIYEQDFSGASNATPPSGWVMSDTALWSIVSSNPSSNYAFASGGNCLKFDNEASELPKTAYATLSGKLDATYYKDLKVIWAARRTNNFFNGAIDGQSFIMYSTNGTSWDTLYYITEPNNSNLWAYVNGGTAISLPEVCNHQANVQLRWLFTSEGVGTSGTYRFDDVKVFATDDTVSTTGLTIIGQNKSVTLSVYPNPGTGIMTISSNNAETQPYTITNMMGQQVETGTLKQTQTIDISAWTNGIYFLYAADQVQKLIIRH